MARVATRNNYSLLLSEGTQLEDSNNFTGLGAQNVLSLSGVVVASSPGLEGTEGVIEGSGSCMPTWEEPPDGVLRTEQQGRGEVVPREVCDAVLHQLHIKMRRQLNFKHLWPFLNQKKLLAATSQADFVDCTKSEDDKCDMLVTALPKFCEQDYLTPFRDCLVDSHKSNEAFGVGSAHIELVEEINALLKNEMSIYRANQMKAKVPWYKKTKAILTIIATVIAIVLVAAVSITADMIAWRFVPNQTSYQLIDHNFIVIDDDVINNQLISSVTVKWNNSFCVSELYVLNGQKCLESTEIIQRKQIFLDKADNYLPFYLIKNSVISIFVPNISSVLDKRIIITRNIQENEDDVSFDMKVIIKQCGVLQAMNCESTNYCHQTSNNLGKTINITINTNGFYNILLISNNKDDQYCILPRLSFGVNYTIYANSINETYIKTNGDNPSLKRTEIKSQPEKVSIFRWFQFHQSRCNVLNYTCPKDSSNLLYITKGNPRGDWLVVIAAVDVGIIAIIVLCVIIFMHFKFHKH